MAITQFSKIIQRTGNLADLPQLAPGELGYATDERRLFIGNEGGSESSTVPDNTEILTTVSKTTAGGANTQVQFNRAGGLDARPEFTYDFDDNSQLLTVPNVSVTNHMTVGNSSSPANHEIFTVFGDANVTGNLVVNGNVTFLDTEVLTVSEPVIHLGTESTSGGAVDAADRGLLMHYVSDAVNNKKDVQFLGFIPNGGNTLAGEVNLTGRMVMGQLANLVTGSANAPNGYDSTSLANNVTLQSFTDLVSGNIVVASMTGAYVPEYGGGMVQARYFQNDKSNIDIRPNGTANYANTGGNFLAGAGNIVMSVNGNAVVDIKTKTGLQVGINEREFAVNGHFSTTRVNSDLIPSVDGSDGVSGYDLGSDDYRWRDLYLSGQSIYLGANGTENTTSARISLGDQPNANSMQFRAPDGANYTLYKDTVGGHSVINLFDTASPLTSQNKVVISGDGTITTTNTVSNTQVSVFSDGTVKTANLQSGTEVKLVAGNATTPGSFSTTQYSNYANAYYPNGAVNVSAISSTVNLSSNGALTVANTSGSMSIIGGNVSMSGTVTTGVGGGPGSGSQTVDGNITASGWANIANGAVLGANNAVNTLMRSQTIFTDSAQTDLFNSGAYSVGAVTYTVAGPNTITMGNAANNVTIAANGSFSTTTIQSATVVGTQATQNAWNTTATTLNLGGATTALNMGATSGTATIRNPVVVGNRTTQDLWNTVATTINFAGAATLLNVGPNTGQALFNYPTIVGSLATQNLWDANARTINFGRAADTFNMGNANSTLNLYADTIQGRATQTTQNLWDSNATTINFGGDATFINVGKNIAGANLTLKSPTIVGTNPTQNVFNTTSTTVNFAGDATTITMGNNTAGGTKIVLRANTIVGTRTSQDLFDTVAQDINFGGAANTIQIGADNGAVGVTTLRSATLVGNNATQNAWNTVATTLNLAGDATTLNIGKDAGTLLLRSSVVYGANATQTLWNNVATTMNFAGAATTANIANIATTFNMAGSATAAQTANVLRTSGAQTANVLAAGTNQSLKLATAGGTLTADALISGGSAAVNIAQSTGSSLTANAFTGAGGYDVNAFIATSGTGTANIMYSSGVQDLTFATTPSTQTVTAITTSSSQTLEAMKATGTQTANVLYSGGAQSLRLGTTTGSQSANVITSTVAQTAINMIHAGGTQTANVMYSVGAQNVTLAKTGSSQTADAFRAGVNQTVDLATAAGTQTGNLFTSSGAQTLRLGITSSTQSANLLYATNTQTIDLGITTSGTQTTSFLLNNGGGTQTIDMMKTTGTQTVNMATTSTASSTYNMMTGSTSSGQTKTINFGTGGASGSTTNMALAGTAGTTTINSPTVVGSQTTQNLWNTVATTINFGGAANSIVIGAVSSSTAHVTQIRNNIQADANVIAPYGIMGGHTGAPSVPIWRVSEQYDNWGIYYAEGSPDTIQFRTGGTTTATIALDTGAGWFQGGVKTTNITTGAASTAGTIEGTWTLTSGSKLQATYADLAERYVSDEQYEPGTVLMIGGEKEVTLATLKGKNKLAGVVSTDPAHVLNSMAKDSVIIGLAGRLPCFVIGKIEKGDMLTISAIPGVATSTDEPIAVIGRALENYDSDQVGKIEIMIGRA